MKIKIPDEWNESGSNLVCKVLPRDRERGEQSLASHIKNLHRDTQRFTEIHREE
jgi:hypothetical protein